MTKQQYKQFVEEKLARGFVPYINPIDIEVAEDGPCGECGSENVKGEGLAYFSYNRSTPSTIIEYHAFAVCLDCGYTVEF